MVWHYSMAGEKRRLGAESDYRRVADELQRDWRK
jgi:hypothetical protein